MNRVRIAFFRGGTVVKSFDRLAANQKAAEELADDIARDGSITADSRTISFERKAAMVLRAADGAVVERLETKALDEADAVAIARRWSQRGGKPFTSSEVVWR